MAKKILLGLIQMKMQSSPAANLSHALDMISQAAKKGASIVCLPELFTTPYFAQYEKASQDFSEKIPGTTSLALLSAAKKHSISIVGGSIYEKSGSRLYNTSMAFSPEGKMLGIYRKTHIPHDENFYEQNYFSPGDTGFKVFQTPHAKISSLICYDQWYPEAARSCALLGADIIFYPTAIGLVDGIEQTEGNWQEAWEGVMKGHAIANNLVVAAVNRCGREGKMAFWGGSFVCDAFGKIIAKAGRGEEVLICPVDLDHSKMVREGWRFFYNRRPEMYKKLVDKK